MKTFLGMNSWLALPLTLLLGQTPTPSIPSDERPLVGSAQQQGQAREPTEEELRAAQNLETQLLRAQLEALRAQMEAQQQENQNRLQSLEQQQAIEEARARELEQLRQQRLVSLERAYGWLVTADQLLESGELAIGPALVSAQRELSNALSTATETGRGQTARLIESALDRLSTVDDAIEERDVYPARLQLQAAGFELRAAWRLTLNRASASLVNQ